jgi:hypothetical protein
MLALVEMDDSAVLEIALLLRGQQKGNPSADLF